ncbi:MAG TPA: glycosyltransferase [Pseudoxanthomonas sp.]|nr:glycosyltransferase [Pseudoxanthomonas sp.]
MLLVLASTYPRWSGDPEPGFVHELCKRLTSRFRVVVVGPHAAGAKRMEMLDGVEVRRYRYAPSALETLINDGGIVTNLRRAPWKWLLLPGFVFGLLWSAWRTVASERPAVAHAHWLLPQGLALAILGMFDRRVPSFLVTSHGADLYALRSPPLQALKRFTARRATALTVVSRAMCEEMATIGIDSTRVAVQPMGVDLTERYTPEANVQRSCDELLFVGRLVEKKGLRHLIDAMPRILEARPSASLVVAGFGPEEVDRKLQVARLGLQDKVRFLGAVPQVDLPALYRHAAVFVAPFVRAKSGDQEGLGLVLVEAIGCGCLAVAGDVPAVRDVLGEFPAICVDVTDHVGLADAVVALLSDRQQAVEQASHLRSTLKERFDWLNVANRYGELLENVSQGRS